MAQPGIEAVIFDCFGVLQVDYTQVFYEENIKDYDRLKPSLVELNRQHDYGLITQAEFIEGVADLSGLEPGFISQTMSNKLARNQPLIEYMARLRSNYKLGMISNISVDSIGQYFAKAELDQMFDAVVLSGEEGIAKPHPRIYEVAAERLGVQPGACVMIDDSEDNCAGADAAGMAALLYRSLPELKRDLSDKYNVQLT